MNPKRDFIETQLKQLTVHKAFRILVPVSEDIIETINVKEWG